MGTLWPEKVSIGKKTPAIMKCVVFVITSLVCPVIRHYHYAQCIHIWLHYYSGTQGFSTAQKTSIHFTYLCISSLLGLWPLTTVFCPQLLFQPTSSLHLFGDPFSTCSLDHLFSFFLVGSMSNQGLPGGGWCGFPERRTYRLILASSPVVTWCGFSDRLSM